MSLKRAGLTGRLNNQPRFTGRRITLNRVSLRRFPFPSAPSVAEINYIEDVFSTYAYTGTGRATFIKNDIALGDTYSGTSIEFNTTSYLVRSSDLNGNVDSKSFTFSFWVYNSTGGLTDYATIFRSNSSRAEMLISSQEVSFDFKNTTGTSIFRGSTTGLRVPYGTFTHVLMSVNLATPTYIIYVNDVNVTGSLSIIAGPNNEFIDFTDTSFGVGAYADGTLSSNFYLSDFFLDYTYRDLSVTANRRLFVTADLKPASGQSSLNPIVYLPFNNTSSPALNQGTGGSFSVVGNPKIVQFGPNSTTGLGKGGLVWIKSRSSALSHKLTDTTRGATKSLISNDTSAEATETTGLTSFNATGFSIGADNDYNTETAQFASWTFRKQAKFFDIVTYTGNGSILRSIPHNLGSVPGCIIVKRTDAAGHNWCVYHRSLPNNITYNLFLNTTESQSSDDNLIQGFSPYLPTSTEFYVAYAAGATAGRVNFPGATYVAYVFAHNAGGFGLTGTDNVISCGSYTGTGADPGPTITLGYEPQWVLIKASSTTNDWVLCDNLRGSVATAGTVGILIPNDPTAEGDLISGSISPSATGFTILSNNARVNQLNVTYIYIAIRRGPMRTPTSGTEVFQPIVYTGTNVDNRKVTTNILTDMIMARQRNSTTVAGFVVGDRLRGNQYVLTGSAAAGVTDADSLMTPTLGYGNSFSVMNGFGVGNDATSQLNLSTVASNHVVEAFKRAPGFLDVVTYTGTSSARTVQHNLGVAPEMIWVKCTTTGTRNWQVYSSVAGPAARLLLNSNGDVVRDTLGEWNGTSPNTSVFTVGTDVETNNSGDSYVAYLMGSVAGVSKCSYYVGRGVGNVNQVDCGFTAGARFVIIKSLNRTGTAGDWYVYDSARGIISGNDPYLWPHDTQAEVTNTDYIDTYANGFELSTTAPDELNDGYADFWAPQAGVLGAADVNEIVYGDNLWVAGGSAGTIAYSSNAYSWSTVAGVVTGGVNSLAYGNGLYVAVGAAGRISTSANAITWSTRTSGTANALMSVTYGLGKFWAAGDTGTVVSSTDGITWSTVSIGTSTNIESVRFLNNTLIFVGASGLIITSTDGTNFTSRTSGVAVVLFNSAYGNNLYVVVGNNGTIITSPDLVTWTSQTSGTANNMRDVVWASYRFVAVAAGGLNRISGDGVTWSGGSAAGSFTLLSAAFANDILLVGNGDGDIYISDPKYIYWAIA